MPTDAATEKSIAVVQQFISDLADDGHLDRPDEYLAHNFVYHDPTYENPELTAQKFQRDFDEIWKAFSNILFRVEEIIASQDRVVVRWVFSGQNTSYIRGLPPTNKPGVLEGIGIFHVENDKITDLWMMTDLLDLLQQLGIIPTLGTMAATDPIATIGEMAADSTTIVGKLAADSIAAVGTVAANTASTAGTVAANTASTIGKLGSKLFQS